MNEMESEEIGVGRAWKVCSTFGNQVTVNHGKEDPLTFTFDFVFDEDAAQSQVFSVAGAPLINDLLDGYNSTIFAYGPTGSGKTYTMIGEDLYSSYSKGIVPRCGTALFEAIRNGEANRHFTVTCSALEVYQERLRDLLQIDNKALKVKESREKGVYIDKLTRTRVDSQEELLAVFELGTKMKTIAATKLNQLSSRSHSLFMIEVKQQLPHGKQLCATLNLVDLAGSEKVNRAQTTAVNFEETKKINLSLSALGNVIHALAAGNPHVPYRDSRLTRILKDSLSGNCKTSLVVNCSTYSGNLEEILSTLRFAQRAKRIKTKAQRNLSSLIPRASNSIVEAVQSENPEILRLKEEGMQLKAQLLARKQRCLADEIDWRLRELVEFNEDKVASHLNFKLSGLLQQLETVNLVTAAADQHLSELKSGTQPDKAAVAVRELRSSLQNSRSDVDLSTELLKWEILTQYTQDKRLAMECLHQQEQLKALEILLGNLRSQNKLLKAQMLTSFNEENSEGHSIEASLETMRTRLTLVKQAALHKQALVSQQKAWATELARELYTQFGLCSSYTALTEVGHVHELLLGVVKEYLELQSQCGIPHRKTGQTLTEMTNWSPSVPVERWPFADI